MITDMKKEKFGKIIFTYLERRGAGFFLEALRWCRRHHLNQEQKKYICLETIRFFYGYDRRRLPKNIPEIKMLPFSSSSSPQHKKEGGCEQKQQGNKRTRATAVFNNTESVRSYAQSFCDWYNEKGYLLSYMESTTAVESNKVPERVSCFIRVLKEQSGFDILKELEKARKSKD